MAVGTHRHIRKSSRNCPAGREKLMVIYTAFACLLTGVFLTTIYRAQRKEDHGRGIEKIYRSAYSRTFCQNTPLRNLFEHQEREGNELLCHRLKLNERRVTLLWYRDR